MKAEIVSRLERLEARWRRAITAGPDHVRLVGINPDGTEGTSVIIQLHPTTRQEARAPARVRLQAD